MKSTHIIAMFSLLLLGCNSNPNKESRIQDLEKQMKNAQQIVTVLDMKLQSLEAENEALETRIIELEKE